MFDEVGGEFRRRERNLAGANFVEAGPDRNGSGTPSRLANLASVGHLHVEHVHFQRAIVTRVPCPRDDSILNSLASRFAPPSPRPSPLRVE
jgi:hypothetical protein